MLAIIKTGGKQYKVEEGQTLQVESLDVAVNDTVQLHDVLMVDTGDTLLVGRPTLENVTIQASVVEHGKGEKVLIFKKKHKKQYQRLKGHRQRYTTLKIDQISLQTEEK